MQNTQKSQIAVLSFYSFVKIEDIDILMQKVLLEAKKKSIKGTILLASEGFNGSIAGVLDDLDFLLSRLMNITRAQYVNRKVNHCDIMPFCKFKVKLKKEIVAMRIEDIDMSIRGKYVSSADWDKLISEEGVINIDTRNSYEVKVGSFKGAIDPMTDTFRQFPKWVEDNFDLLKKSKKIAMYCTGGIRCEKSTAYLRSLGFDEVYHLEGGILQYLEDTKNKSKMWQGKCFVFDERVSVDEQLAASYDLEPQKPSF